MILKTSQKFQILQENKNSSFTSNSIVFLESHSHCLQNPIPKKKTKCQVEVTTLKSAFDVLHDSSKMLYTPSDILLVNSGNNQEEVFLRTNALATGLADEHSSLIYYTRFVDLIRNSNYEIVQNRIQFSLLTMYPKTKIPKFTTRKGIAYKTYLDETERNDMSLFISKIFAIANSLEIKVLILQDVACSNGYMHPKEEIFSFIKENILKHRHSCFEKIFLCFKEESFTSPRFRIDEM